MAAHVHAELMDQYAQDATKTNKPWEFWQLEKREWVLSSRRHI